MIKLTEKIPQAIEVGGVFYRIHTDFKFFLIMRERLKEKASIESFDFMYIGKKPQDRQAGLNELINFMNPPRLLPRKTSSESNEIVLDYETDAPYIYAAFYENYGIDITETPLHWYKFLALLYGLHDTELNRIISCRLWKPNGKNDECEKQKQKQYEAWRLPQPEDDEPDEALNEFLSKIKG